MLGQATLNSGRDDGFSDWLQLEIDRAGHITHTPHKKWPLVAGSVVIPPGIHHVYKPVRVHSGVQILGSSQASTALISHLREDSAVFSTDPELEVYAIKIGHFHVIAANMFQGRFLELNNANRNCVIHDVFIEKFKLGIKSVDCYTVAFRDIGIYHCRSGFLALNLTNGRVENVKIENCSEHGFELTNSEKNTTTGTEVRGLVCQGNGFSGVLLHGLDQIHFSSLFLEGNNREAIRESASDEKYGQLSVVANSGAINKRNGNLVFDSIFITPGHSTVNSSPAIDLNYAENIRFNGGYIRTNRLAFVPAFRIASGVNVCSIDGVTLQGFREADIMERSESTKLTVRDLVLVRPGPGAGKRLSDVET
jgi:hypothetical protein